MKIEIIATEKLTHFDGVPVRLWEGVTESGVKCKVFVHRLAVHDDDDASQFEKELAEQVPPGQTFPLSEILDRGEARAEAWHDEHYAGGGMYTCDDCGALFHVTEGHMCAERKKGTHD